MPREIGGSSDIVSGGFIYNDYNPDMRFPQSIDKYNEMRDSDAIVSAGLMSCKLPILSTKYEVQPASEDTRDVEIADYVKKLFGINETPYSDKMSWRNFLFHCLLSYDYGFMYFEKVYEKYDDKWALHKMAPRMPESIQQFIGEDGNPGITQTATINPFTKKEQIKTVSIPDWKLFHIAYNQEGDNLAGKSILRSAYKHWYMKSTAEKIQMIGIERHGTGIPSVTRTQPGTQTEKEKKETLQTLQNMRANSQGYLYMPFGMEFKFMTVDGDLPDIDKPIERFSYEIAIALQSKWLTTGISNGGYSQSKNETDFLFNALKGNIDLILERVHRLEKEFVDLNFDNVEEYPKIIASDLGKIDVNAFSTAIERLSRAGIVLTDPTTQNIIRKNVGLPELTEEQYEEIEEEKKEAQKQFEPIQDEKDEKPATKKDTKDAEDDVKEEKKNPKTDKLSKLTAKQKEKEFVDMITDNERKINEAYLKMKTDIDNRKDKLKKFIKSQYKKAKTTTKAGQTVLQQEGNFDIIKAINDKVKEEFKTIKSKYGQNYGKKIAESAYNRGLKVAKLKGNTNWSTKGYLYNIGKVFDKAPTNIIEKINDHFGTFALAALAADQIDNIVDGAYNANELKLSHDTYPRSAFKQAIFEENGTINNWKMVLPIDVFNRYKTERPSGFSMLNVFLIGTLAYWASKRDDENANPLIFPIHPNSLDYYMPISDEDLEEQEALSQQQRKKINNLSYIWDKIEDAKANKDRAELKSNLYKLCNLFAPREPITLDKREAINDYINEFFK